MIAYFDLLFDDVIDICKDLVTIDNLRLKDGDGNVYDFSPLIFETWQIAENKLCIKTEFELDGKLIDRLFLSDQSLNKTYFDEIVITTNELSSRPIRFTSVTFKTRRKETKMLTHILDEMSDVILWAN